MEESSSPQEERPSFLSPEEDKTLKEIREIRMGLTKLLTRDDEGNLVIPKSTSEKVLLTGLLDGIEREVLTRARLKVSSDEAAATTDLKGAMVEMLKAHAARRARPAAAEERVLPEIVRPENVVPGEMDIGNNPLTLADVMGTSKKEN